MIPDELIADAAALAVLTGIALILLAHGLTRGQRAAHRVGCVTLVTAAVAHLAKGADVEEATVCLLVCIWLLRRRALFTARIPSGTVSAAKLTGVLGLVTVSAVTIVATAGNAIAGRRSPIAVLATALTGLAGFPRPLHPVGAAGRTVTHVLLALGAAAVTLLAATVVYSRARLTRDLSSATHPDPGNGHDPLSYFAQHSTRYLVASPSAKAAISYLPIADYAVAYGDPLGDPEAWPPAINAFLELAEQHGLIPVVIGASQRGARAYQRDGFRCLEVGDEAILDLGLVNEGSVRGSVELAAEWTIAAARNRELPGDIRHQLQHEPTLSLHPRSFGALTRTLGRVGDPHDADTVMVIARDADGGITAVLQLVPWEPCGFTAEPVRGTRATDPELVEALLTTAITWCQQHGASRLDAGFVPGRDVLARGNRLGAAPAVRAHRRLLLMLGRWWPLHRRYDLLTQLGAQWEPRYVCYLSSTHLIQATAASLWSSCDRRRSGKGETRRHPLARTLTGAAPTTVPAP